jgi:electron transfer flavoprotein alpha subunit
VSTLVFLEHHGNELQKGSLGVLSKAATLGDSDVAGVIAGPGAAALASEAGKFGATKVWVAEDAALESPLPQPRVDVLAKVVREGGYDTVLFAASVLGADVAAGLAARLDAGLNWDLVDLVREDGRLVGKRAALGDSVYVDVGWKSDPKIALVRSGTFEPAATGGEPEVAEVAVELEDFSTRATMLEQAHEEQAGPSIEDADIIVAGGRGLGGPENFALVEDLAKALGGAVAATRAVVDAGWYPYSAQVGQTG